MTLRLADPSDEPAIFHLLEQFYKEAPHNQYASWNDWKVKSSIHDFLTANKNEKIIILAERDNKIVGILAALATEVFFSIEKRAYETVWYILPEYKNTRASIQLLKAYEYWAKKVGCSSVALSTMLHNPRLGKFYNKLGYTVLEQSYIKRL